MSDERGAAKRGAAAAIFHRGGPIPLAELRERYGGDSPRELIDRAMAAHGEPMTALAERWGWTASCLWQFHSLGSPAARARLIERLGPDWERELVAYARFYGARILDELLGLPVGTARVWLQFLGVPWHPHSRVRRESRGR